MSISTLVNILFLPNQLNYFGIDLCDLFFVWVDTQFWLSY
jgi:hypothetical protein